jgi:hypothetical protein
MLGVEPIIDAYVTYLGAVLGPICATAGCVPPVSIRAQDRAHDEVVDAYPIVVVQARETASIVKRDVTDEGVIYHCTYNLRVRIITRGGIGTGLDPKTGWDQTDRERKRLVVAVRQALLSKKQVTPDIRMTSVPLTEKFYELVEPSRNPTGRTLAGGEITLQVETHELLPDTIALLPNVVTTTVDPVLLTGP